MEGEEDEDTMISIAVCDGGIAGRSITQASSPAPGVAAAAVKVRPSGRVAFTQA
jgi:hypothetical protein